MGLIKGDCLHNIYIYICVCIHICFSYWYPLTPPSKNNKKQQVNILYNIDISIIVYWFYFLLAVIHLFIQNTFMKHLSYVWHWVRQCNVPMRMTSVMDIWTVDTDKWQGPTGGSKKAVHWPRDQKILKNLKNSKNRLPWWLRW